MSVVCFTYCYFFRENNKEFIKNINLKGLGIGNGFVAPEYQSLYSEYMNSIAYLTKIQNDTLWGYDQFIIEKLKKKEYNLALSQSNRALHFIGTEIMNLTNIYDFTYNRSS